MQPVTPTRRTVADLSLLGVALIWGLTFVMVQDAVRVYPLFAFLSARFFMAFLAIIPVALLLRHRTAGWGVETRLGKQIEAGVVIGLFLFAGYSFQTSGLQYTTPAKTGFITGLYVVMAPIFGMVFAGERPGRWMWVGIGMALTGLGLLSLARFDMPQGTNPGDVLVLIGAISFAGHIFLIGRFSHRMNPLILTLTQLLTVSMLAGIASQLFESPASLIPRGQPLFAAIFTGVLATAAAFGVQTVAQRFTAATHTALIFSTEPVFAALGSFLFIGEVLNAYQLLGAALILAGMLTAKLGPGRMQKASSNSCL